MRPEPGQPKPGFSPRSLPYSDQQIQSWKEFHEEFWELAVRYAYARCGTLADAEDAASKAIEKAATTYNGTSSRKTWLTWQLKGAITEARRNGSQRQPMLVELMEETAETLWSIEEDKFLNLENREQRRLLAKALRSLGKQYRRLYWLQKLRNLSYVDIVSRPHWRKINVNWGRQIVHRATKQVRRRIIALMDSPGAKANEAE
jgi:RNA polymerase sigma factor (sigma-70 family)